MGWGFSTFALALTILWIILAAMGPKAGNKKVWAQMNLRYSIIYLFLILFSMVLITFFTG
jgi:protoheme IX farnesyltransferase